MCRKEESRERRSKKRGINTLGDIDKGGMRREKKLKGVDIYTFVGVNRRRTKRERSEGRRDLYPRVKKPRGERIEG